MHSSKRIFTKNIHPICAGIYVRKSHISHACMFQMISQPTEDREGGRGGSEKNKWNEAETQ